MAVMSFLPTAAAAAGAGGFAIAGGGGGVDIFSSSRMRRRRMRIPDPTDDEGAYHLLSELRDENMGVFSVFVADIPAPCTIPPGVVVC